MTEIELGLLIALVGCIISVVGSLFKGKSMSKKDGEEWGKLSANIDYIQRDIKDIKNTLLVGMQNSIKGLHKRIDKHLKEEHRMVSPREDDEY